MAKGTLRSDIEVMKNEIIHQTAAVDKLVSSLEKHETSSEGFRDKVSKNTESVKWITWSLRGIYATVIAFIIRKIIG